MITQQKIGQRKTIMYRLWTLAEHADLAYWRPHWFWGMLMFLTDRYYGYKNPFMDYFEGE